METFQLVASNGGKLSSIIPLYFVCQSCYYHPYPVCDNLLPSLLTVHDTGRCPCNIHGSPRSSPLKTSIFSFFGGLLLGWQLRCLARASAGGFPHQGEGEAGGGGGGGAPEPPEGPGGAAGAEPGPDRGGDGAAPQAGAGTRPAALLPTQGEVAGSCVRQSATSVSGGLPACDCTGHAQMVCCTKMGHHRRRMRVAILVLKCFPLHMYHVKT